MALVNGVPEYIREMFPDKTEEELQAIWKQRRERNDAQLFRFTPPKDNLIPMYGGGTFNIETKEVKYDD